MTTSSSNLRKCNISEPQIIMELLSPVVLNNQLNQTSWITLSTDLYPRFGGVSGMFQSKAERKVTEACGAAGEAWW